MKAKKKYYAGGKAGNPDKKVRSEVGQWYMKQSKEIKAMFDNAYESAAKRGASPAQSRESAIRAVEKSIGKPIQFRHGGKVSAKKKYYAGGKVKYLKGGQVKLDKNKDGELTGEDFKLLRGEG